MATVKTKLYFSEQVLLELNSQFRNRDEKIDQREVILRMDQIVNYGAKMGIFESWNLGEKSIDDQYITTWDGRLNSWLPITDVTDNGESYFALPSNYVVLPRNGGIVRVYLEKNYFDPIAILTPSEAVTIRNTLAGNLEGRLGVYLQGSRFYFKGRQDISSKFGGAGLQLVIRDASAINDDAPYPIDAGMEDYVIRETVKWFRERKNQGADTVRESIDTANLRKDG
jgi:hypothetical protein